MKAGQLHELLYQALETELGGIEVYTTALSCAVNSDLAEEWEENLEQTTNHERIVRETMAKLGLDPRVETPGRAVVRHIGKSLVEAMQMAKKAGANAAQVVAAECVVLAETKHHLNWELIGAAANALKGEEAAALKAAHEGVEDEEGEQLFHSRGWARELWVQSLGVPAQVPPPEEKRDVETAIGVGRAKLGREQMLPSE